MTAGCLRHMMDHTSKRRLTILLLWSVALDAVLEVVFVASMVIWVRKPPSRTVMVDTYDGTVTLSEHPRRLLAFPGHIANAAAVITLLTAGLGVAALFSTRSGPMYRTHSKNVLQGRSATQRRIYGLWRNSCIIASLMTLIALTATFTLHGALTQQSIQIADIPRERTDMKTSLYPQGIWTPEHWLTAVSQLSRLTGEPYLHASHAYLRLIRGYRWNLIPLLSLNGAMCICAIYGRKYVASAFDTTTSLAENGTR
ncbi:hypothetical protein LTR49_028757, partial [Elasticomyces elasticus]